MSCQDCRRQAASENPKKQKYKMGDSGSAGRGNVSDCDAFVDDGSGDGGLGPGNGRCRGVRVVTTAAKGRCLVGASTWDA